jgi:glycerate kinase
MEILIAIDKFKGSLSSLEAAHAISKGVKDASINIVPMADGGDGSIESIMPYLKSDLIQISAHNPIGRKINSEYLLYVNSNRDINKLSAFIEMAKISGLLLLQGDERNPLNTSTYGLGELIKDAINKGAKEINVSIGGSATNDGGTGLLQALGCIFYDKKGDRINHFMCGGNLANIGTIEISDDFINLVKDIDFNVICDVDNSLLGRYGATYMYGVQKGASEEMLVKLENGMINYVNSKISFKNCDSSSGYNIGPLEISQKRGAGAAGGVGYAMNRFLCAKIISGWRYFAEISDLESKIAKSDIIISGEGKIDEQSFNGKVIDGVMSISVKYKKPIILFCGVNELNRDYFKNIDGLLGVYEIRSIEPDLNKSMSNAGDLLTQLASRYCKL